jgi:DNA-binding PadR family transcriptional regulator
MSNSDSSTSHKSCLSCRSLCWYISCNSFLVRAALFLRQKLSSSSSEISSFVYGFLYSSSLAGYIYTADKKQGRGKEQVYYAIKDKGLRLLIISDDKTHPLKFWKALLGYSHHNKKAITSAKMEECYQLFMEKYLKYKNHSFSFQFDIFDNMRDKWLQDFILDKDKISLQQKVLEVLALYPYIDQSIIGKKYNKKYWDFLLHSTVRIQQNNEGLKTYELSLFGVILVLTLIRYYDKDRLNHALYYQHISFPKYYDKIARNYHNRLPLIFGKWPLLKRN